MRRVVVVGAGPYGLSIAANLKRAGLDVQVFGRPMEMWAERMPQGMLLKSEGFATSFGGLPLTLGAFCEQAGRPYAASGYRLPLNDLVSYGKAIQKEYVGPVDDERVVCLKRCKSGFIVCLANGKQVVAERVVSATGLTWLEFVPSVVGLPDHHIVHVSRLHDLRPFAGRRVLMLGGGQSAYETAALLHEAGAIVEVLTRSRPRWHQSRVPTWWDKIRRPEAALGPGWKTMFWSESRRTFWLLPRSVRNKTAYLTFGPSGSDWLRSRVIGKFPIETGTIQRAHTAMNGLRVTVEVDGRARVVEIDHLIAATGYKPDIRKIPFMRGLLPEIRMQHDGVPILSRSFETTVQGLHVVGYLSAGSWGPSMRFIYGTNFVAPYLTRLFRCGITFPGHTM